MRISDWSSDVCSSDLRDRSALHAAAADFLAGGFVDIVIASAGISIGTLTEELDDHAVFESIMAVNLNATVSTFEPFIASMKQRGRGRLVGISRVAEIGRASCRERVCKYV